MMRLCSVCKNLPTDVEVALVLQHGPDIRRTLLQEVLDVDLLCLVPRERHVDLVQHSVVTVMLQLFLVDVVLVFMTTAKEQDCWS